MQELLTYSGQAAVFLAAVAIGWMVAFSFIVAPVAFKNMIYSRADRYIRQVIMGGHGLLALVCFAVTIFALGATAWAGALVAFLAGAFFIMCRWAVAPRTDKRAPGARRQIKGQRIVASWLTAFGIPLMITAAILIQLGI